MIIIILVRRVKFMRQKSIIEQIKIVNIPDFHRESSINAPPCLQRLGRSSHLSVEYIALYDCFSMDVPSVLKSFVSKGPLTIRGIGGSDENFARAKAAHVLIVCGSDIQELRQAIAFLRGASIFAPTFAYVETQSGRINADLLNAGYDDVISLEMADLEVHARISAMCARHGVYDQNPEFAAFQRRTQRETLTSGEYFTVREKAILELLLRNDGRIVPYDALFKRLNLDVDSKSRNILRVVVSGIRQKLDDCWNIHGVYGQGYSLELSCGQS